MLHRTLTLVVSALDLAICSLPPDADLPGWIDEQGFLSVTRTQDELSIVCSEHCVPQDVTAERHWHMVKVKGHLDLSVTGIIVSLTTPLSDAGIAVFVISTFGTDYLLIKAGEFERALEILGKSCTVEK